MSAGRRKMARCHPDRPNFAKETCSSCYTRSRRQQRRVVRRTKRMGLNHLGERLDAVRPTLRRVPEVCPRCDNACLRHYAGTPEVTCIICGWEGILEPPVGQHGLLWR